MNLKRSWASAIAVSLGWALLVPACGGEDDRSPDDADDHDGGGGADDAGSGGGGDDAPDGGGFGGDASGGSGGSGSLPSSCDEIECLRGTCDDSSGVAVCECEPGFAGDDCQDVNECTSGTSCGMGSCVNTWGGYYCACEAGYAFDGSTCSNENECSASPCASGATCTDRSGGYDCTCGSNFGNGWACSTPNHCASNPCGSGATCVSTASGAACLCPAGKGGDGDCALDCSSLNVTDAGLIAAIEELVGLPIDQIDPAVDLAGESYLDLSGLPVYSLDGLECWPHLEELYLANTPLGAPGPSPLDATPVEALGSLHALRTLDLSCTPLADLDVLQDHPTLRRLIIDQRGCTSSWSDLSALSSLRQLEALSLIAVGVSSLPQVSGLEALREVDASENELDSAAPFAGLPLLKTLTLRDNQLTDAASLSTATGLRELDLSDNQLTSVAFVTSLTKLEYLRVTRNALESLPSLAALTALRVLFAEDNELSSVTNVAANAGLQIVSLGANQITDAQPFVGTGFRGDLQLSGNPVCTSQADVFLKLERDGVRVTCTP